MKIRKIDENTHLLFNAMLNVHLAASNGYELIENMNKLSLSILYKRFNAVNCELAANFIYELAKEKELIPAKYHDDLKWLTAFVKNFAFDCMDDNVYKEVALSLMQIYAEKLKENSTVH